VAHNGGLRDTPERLVERGAVVVKREDLEAERAWTHIVVSALGAVVTATVLVALYYLLPLDDLSGASAVSGLFIGIVVFVALIGWQVWRILRSDHPGSRALEGLFVAVPLFILLSADGVHERPSRGWPPSLPYRQDRPAQ
jgi:L-cystine uptake protein TcyP (sodium:dicarboxylate symporter family)